jgi:hypothetical protein
MKIEPGVVDANILVYALDTGAPQYAASNSLLKAASSLRRYGQHTDAG